MDLHITPYGSSDWLPTLSDALSTESVELAQIHATSPMTDIFRHSIVAQISSRADPSRDSENSICAVLDELCDADDPHFEQRLDLFLSENYPQIYSPLKKAIYQDPLLLKIARESTDLKYICIAATTIISDLFGKFDSMTALYQTMTKNLYDDFLVCLKINEKAPVKKVLNIQNNPEVQAYIEFLESKAWGNLCENQAANSPYKHPNTVSAFAFLDFQDFFAARHMARLMKVNSDEAKDMLIPNKSNLKFERFFWFLAGLLRDNPSALNALFEILDDHNQAIGIYALQLKIRCLEECNFNDSLKNKDRYLKEIKVLGNHLFNPNFWQLIKKPLLKTLEISPLTAINILSPLISEGIHHKDKQVRINAVQVLVKCHCIDFSKSRKLLQIALNDEEPEVRALATHGIGKFKFPQSVVAMHLLHDASSDPSHLIRKTAAKTLGQIGHGNPDSAISLLLDYLFDLEKQVQNQAIESLCKLGQQIPEKILQTLKAKYRSTQKNYKKKLIIRTFGELGIEERWLKTIIKNDPFFKDDAAQALAKVGIKKPLEIVPQLLKLVRTPNNLLVNIIIPAVIQLGKIHPNPVLEEIKALIENEDCSLYAQHLAIIVGEIGRDIAHYGQNKDEVTFELLMSLYKKYPDRALAEIACAMDLTGRDAQDSVFILHQLLQSKSMEVKVQTIKALGFYSTLPTTSTQICQILISFLNNQNDDVRVETIKALGKTNELHLIHTAILESQRMQSHEFTLAAIKVLGEIGKGNPSLAIELIKLLMPILVNSQRLEEVNEAVKSITLLGNLDHLGAEITKPLIDLLIANLRVHQSCDDDASAASSACITRALGIITDCHVKLIILALETAFSARKNQKEIDCSNVEKAEFETMSSIVQKNFSAAELEQLITFINRLYLQGNQRVKMFTLELITKLNAPAERIIELLFNLPLSNISDHPSLAKLAILALGDMRQADLEKFSPFLESQLYHDSACREEACLVLSRFDLSSYPTTMAKLLSNRDFLKPLADPLKKTPLEEILKKYLKTSEPSHPEYLLALSHKCLAENKELFVNENKLCFYSDNELNAFDGTFNLSLIQGAYRKYQKELILYRAQHLTQSHFNELAGDYYKQAGDLRAMIQCYKVGLNRFDEILQEKPSNCAQELQEQIGAVFSLGMCYQSGLGLSLEEMAGRLKKAADCYEKEASLAKFKLTHFSSKYLLAVCNQYGLGLAENKEKAQRIFKELDATIPPVALHFFNSSKFCFLLDRDGLLCAAGTVALALASIHPSAIDRDEIIENLEKNQRPDHHLPVPYVQIEGNNNLVIRLPSHPIYGEGQLTKFLHLGLVGEPIPDSPMPNSKWSYNHKFVVEEYEIESFLRDKLGLHADVYTNLIDVAKRTGRLQERDDNEKCTIL